MNKVITPVYSTALSIVLVAVLLVNGPVLEQKFFPVTSDSEIIRSESDGPDHVKIWVAFKKGRTCTFMDLTFYKVGASGHYLQVTHEFLDDKGGGTNSRPEGKQVAGPWRLAITPEDLMGNLVGYTRHSCHILWDTVTKFYP